LKIIKALRQYKRASGEHLGELYYRTVRSIELIREPEVEKEYEVNTEDKYPYVLQSEEEKAV
jgi:hypothetical protein